MALQAASLVPASFSLSNEGKSGVSLKDSSLFGLSLSEPIKAYFSSSALRCKRDFHQKIGAVRAETVATASPAVSKSTTEGKKTLRKGSVVITGASSGLGLATAKALAETGKWHIIMACRDYLKAARAAKSAGMAKENYTIMHLDLASLDSVRQFVDNFRRSDMPLDVLVCNAAVYLPTAKEPTFTAEGFELSVGTNHLGHFLLARLLLEDLNKSDYPSKRLIIVGSITGNTNTLAGNVPPKANLGDLRGLQGGLNGLNSSAMIDGGDFDGAKAYKDSKVCNMLTMQEFHRRYHEETGITFASLYPGCIATTGLFREHIPLFRTLFPPFQKYITKGFVSEDEAGKRLAQVVSDPSLTKSGVYWSWNKTSASFENQLSQEASDAEKARKHLLSSSMDKTVRLWHLSSKSCLKIFSHSDYVTCIQFNPVDDRYFISGSLDAKVRIWSIPDRQVVDWTDLHEMVTAACYTPDGQGALVGSYKGSCHLYNTSENKLQQKSQINLQNKKKKSHHKKITGFQFAPGSSSEVLITSADSRIRVVDGVDLVHKFKGFRNANSPISASLTANGKHVIAASEDSYVYIWKNEADCRPIRGKCVTVTRSYEHFHCKDVSVAIPWPGMGNAWDMHDTFSGEQPELDNNADEVSSANHPPTPVEENFVTEGSRSTSSYSNSPHHATIASATNSYFFDRISATWPEEKLVLATRNQSPRISMEFSNGVSPKMSAWGMVIVTAGLRGEIRTFQNFGLPLRI